MARDTRAYVDTAGHRLPSVTEILQIAGLSSLGGIAPDVLEAAAQRGRDVHEWTHALDTGQIDPGYEAPQEIAGYVAAYLRFREESRAQVLKSEFLVRHEALRYVGTADRLLLMPREPGEWIVDLKTGSALTPETAVQIAGYAFAHGPVAKRAALHLRADGTYRLRTYEDPADLHVWTAAVRIAHWRLAHGLARLEETR